MTLVMMCGWSMQLHQYMHLLWICHTITGCNLQQVSCHSDVNNVVVAAFPDEMREGANEENISLLDKTLFDTSCISIGVCLVISKMQLSCRLPLQLLLLLWLKWKNLNIQDIGKVHTSRSHTKDGLRKTFRHIGGSGGISNLGLPCSFVVPRGEITPLPRHLDF